MGKIHVMDAHLANQIAAGEVVERPSSVVKELVENAIDAGSRTIDVTVEEGGMKGIRVVDDGFGIEPEDLAAAFERHATSKIRTSKDLFAIRTLGFRGEALPSVAAVSRVECLSSSDGSGLGRRIVLEGGSVVSFEEAACPRGTDFRVMDLFFNTPARLKYMKTVQTELGHITDFLYRLSLSRPDIAFRLDHNGSLLLQTAGNGDLTQAAAAVYGTATAKRMLPIERQTPDFRITGLTARPDITRANRAGITIVVNGRFVRNFQSVQAVISGYHTLLPINRFPLAIVHIEMEPSLLDVNVHPAKLEVRFSKEMELTEAITQAVRQALAKETLIPSGVPERMKRDYPRADSIPQKPVAVQEALPLYDTRSSPALKASVSSPAPFPASPSLALELKRRDQRGASESWEKRDTEKLLRAMSPPAAPNSMSADGTPEEEATATDVPRFPYLYPIGQALGTYIIAQNEDGLYLIDQHAAHERINYEIFYEKFGGVEPVSQGVLLSHTMEFTSAEAELLRSRLPLLESVGVYLEPFGGNTFKVRSHPAWFPEGQEAELIEEMAQWVLAEKKPDVAKIREASAIMCSCKASIKANQAQSLEALEALIRRLSDCSNPFTCPHGRPIVVSFTKRELEKMFKRVM